jgi:hypothetical protein
MSVVSEAQYPGIVLGSRRIIQRLTLSLNGRKLISTLPGLFTPEIELLVRFGYEDN